MKEHTSPHQPNTQLRQERRLRNWTQAYVAEQVGVEPDAVSHWERGIKSPSLYARKKLCSLFGKSLAKLGLDEELPAIRPPSLDRPLLPQEQPFPAIWTVPYEQNPLLTGRDELLEALHQSFMADKAPVLTQVLTGLGGVGKTQSAVEYCYRYREHYEAVLWVEADSAEGLTASLLRVAKQLKLSSTTTRSQQQLLNALREWMRTQPYWLLVLDNVEDLESIKSILPPARRGHVLLTMRSQLTGVYPKREVLALSEDDGAFFLLRRANLIEVSEREEAGRSTERDIAHRIAQTLGGLPLALEQAGAYIQETGCSLSTYLDRYHHRRAEMLQYRGEGATDYPASVATTWSLSFERVQQAHTAAAEILQIAAFLHPDAIPEELFLQEARTLGPALQELAQSSRPLDPVLTTLLRYSLIRRMPRENLLSVHRLVQAVISDSMDHETQQTWAKRVIAALGHQLFHDMAREYPYQRYGQQAHAAVRLVNQWAVASSEAAQVLCAAGKYCYSDGWYRRAEALGVQALHLLQQCAPTDEIIRFHCLMLLVATKTENGDLLEAEALGKQALVQSERIFGPTHALTALCQMNLGHILLHRECFEQAEPLLQRVLEQATSLPRDFPRANALLDLAHIRTHRGQLLQAEALCQEALTASEQRYGPGHPHVADVLTELAVHYAVCGEIAKAADLRRQANAIYTATRPADHPDRVIALAGLSMNAFLQGKTAEADAYFEQALSLWKRICRDDLAPHVWGIEDGQERSSDGANLVYALETIERTEAETLASVAQKLADRALEQGSVSTAQEILWHAFEIAEQRCGKKAMITACCLENLANLYQRQKAYQFAEFLSARAIQISIETARISSAEAQPLLLQYLQLLQEMGKGQHHITAVKNAFQRLTEQQGQAEP